VALDLFSLRCAMLLDAPRVHLFVIRDINACNFAPVITGVIDTKTKGWAANAGYRAAAGLP
jgi:hypothetical protein